VIFRQQAAQRFDETPLPERPTPRERVEHELVTRFPMAIRANDPSIVPELSRFSDGTFGSSLLSMLLYCNGRNPETRSTYYPDGLFYSSEGAGFGIGTFVSSVGGGGGVHLVAPRGPACTTEANRVAAFLTSRWPRLRVYARHLPQSLYRFMIATGAWLPVDSAPWIPSAPQEDETFHHRRVTLSELLEATPAGLALRLLPGEERREFRRKSRLAYNRFRNFLARNEVAYVLRPHTSSTVPLVLDLVKGHFDDLIRAGRTAVGSSHHDYGGLACLVPQPGGRCRCLVGFLEGSGWQLPVSFFAVEELGNAAAGCYATITRRNPGILPPGTDSRGFSAIASFALIELCARMLTEGFQTLDLGGSETADLDRFKRQLGAQPDPTAWAVFRGG
jgi:hypothetical protein